MSRKICILTLLGLLIGAPVTAQELTSTEPEPVPAEVSPPDSTADIAKRADEVSIALLNMQESLDSDTAEIADIPENVNALQADLDERLHVLAPGEIDNMRLVDAEALVQTLARMTRELESWGNRLQRRSDELDMHGGTVKLQLDYFQSILTGENNADLPDALVERVNSIIAQLEDSREFVRTRLDRILAELTRISSVKLRIREATHLIESHQQQQEGSTLTFDRPPIWKIEPAPESLAGRVPYEIRTRLDGVSEFAKANQPDVIVTFILLVIMLVLSVYGRSSIMHLGEDRDIDMARRPFIERPISLAILLWAIVVPQIFLPTLPLALSVARLLIVIAALWRMLALIAPEVKRGSLSGLLVLAALDATLHILPPSDLFDRAILLFLGVAGIYFFRSFGRALAATPAPKHVLWSRIGRIVTGIAPVLLGISILGIVIGAVALADQTMGSLFTLVTVLVAIVVVEDSLNTLVHFFVAGPGGRWLRSIRRYPDLARRRLAILIRFAMLAIFLSILPRIMPFVGLLYEWLIAILTADMSIGTVQISIDDILALILGLVVALYVAKFIRFTLDEDIFPRLPIATGAAAAASRLIYYALVAGGIMFALAVSGVELTKLTLLISALGVGIGFGLQGIVNNFVSGLVLAFERPFQVGDIIAVGTVTGRVREIGLRASRVRTFDGAEVIVPNADLISGEVVNWTLSDRMRRLELKVGVAYGSDPTEVRRILLKVAEESDTVAENPEPAALFDGFGDSSLDFTLRAWIPEAGDWPQLSSDLYEAVHAALNTAGITIPFPQRTLHIQRDDRVE